MKQTNKGYSQRIPWWVYVIIAAFLYMGLTYFAPTLHTENQWISAMLRIAPNLAPIGTIAFLLLGAKALYDTPEKKDKPPNSLEDDT
jgi:hypothetical protein